MKKRLVSLVFGVTLLAVLAFAATALAQQPMAMSSQQQAILAETSTLTPQRTAAAGFTDLPLRNCEGLSCGVLGKMALGAQIDILIDDREGWALAHVPSLNLYGWVNTHNIY
jgi:hypothetical protein